MRTCEVSWNGGVYTIAGAAKTSLLLQFNWYLL